MTATSATVKIVPNTPASSDTAKITGAVTTFNNYGFNAFDLAFANILSTDFIDINEYAGNYVA